MSASRLRVGVVGVGHLGRHHARLLAAMPGVELVGVVDLDASRAQAVAASCGTRAETDLRALVGRVDAVTIAVPTAAHLAVARTCIEAGVPVLVEKPLASTLAEADALLALADARRVIVATGHTERFNPAVEAALGLIREPRFIEIHRLSGFPERSLDIDVVFDVMIHDLDLILAIDPTPVVSVEAVGVPVLTSRADIANARIRFASGCIANLTASRISRDKVRKLRCFQQDLYVSVDAGDRTVEVWRLDRTAGPRPAIAGGPVEVADAEPLARELEDFVDAVRHQRPPRVTGVAGRAALALATRVADAMEGTT